MKSPSSYASRLRIPIGRHYPPRRWERWLIATHPRREERGDKLTRMQSGAEPGKHRARLSRWRRLGLAIGGVFHSQRRQCLAGHHRYTDPSSIGGGIIRSRCLACGTISLDLREANEPAETQLFKRQDELRTFAILRRQTFYHR
jgi:hypothetical protein